jgi:hypothetical protein
MSAPQPLAVVALARRFHMHPGAASVLVTLYKTRHARQLCRLASAAGTTENTIRVYISQIRGILGVFSVTCDYRGGYLLGDEARKDIRKALGEMHAEMASFIEPLLAA